MSAESLGTLTVFCKLAVECSPLPLRTMLIYAGVYTVNKSNCFHTTVCKHNREFHTILGLGGVVRCISTESQNFDIKCCSQWVLQGLLAVILCYNQGKF